jgi:hypothetical protein
MVFKTLSVLKFKKKIRKRIAFSALGRTMDFNYIFFYQDPTKKNFGHPIYRFPCTEPRSHTQCKQFFLKINIHVQSC